MSLALLLSLVLAQEPNCPMPGEESKEWLALVRYELPPSMGRPCKVVLNSSMRIEVVTTYTWEGDRLVKWAEHVGGKPSRLTVMRHDDHGRLVSMTETQYPVGEAREAQRTFQYDSCGRLVGSKASHPPFSEGETTLTYDEKGRLKSVHSVNRGRFAYDFMDVFTYEAGRLVGLERWRDGKHLTWERYAYDAQGHRVSRTTGRGLVETWVYDESGRETYRQRRNPDGSLFDWARTHYDDETNVATSEIEVPGDDGYSSRAQIFHDCSR